MEQVGNMQDAPQQLQQQGHQLVKRIKERQRLRRSNSSTSSLEPTSAACCAEVCAGLQLLLGLFLLYLAIFVIGKSGVFPLKLEVAVFLLGYVMVLVSCCACLNKPLFRCAYACANLLILGSLGAGALLLVAVLVADVRDPGQLYFPNATDHLRLPNATVAVPPVKPITSFTSWALQHDSARQMFVKVFKRGAFDCEVEEDGANCSAAGGIQCKASSGEDFQWVVNQLCQPSKTCERCLQELEVDPLEARNRIWCKCTGALEERLRQSWPVVLGLVMWQGTIAAIAVKAVCSCCSAKEELTNKNEREPLINEKRKSFSSTRSLSQCSV